MILKMYKMDHSQVLPLHKAKQKLDIQRKDDFCQEYNFNNRLIYARKYGGLWAERLCYPTQRFDESFRDTQKIIANQLKNEPHIQDLSIQIVNHIKENVNFDYINCSRKRDIIDFVIKLCIRTLVNSYCIDVNFSKQRFSSQ